MKTVGKEIRLGRFIDARRNVVIVAVDHGAEMGPIKGLTDLPKTVESLTAADGLLVNPETLSHCKHVFARKNSPTLLTRVTWTTAYCMPWKYDQAHTTLVTSVEDALAAGADLVTACCVLQSGDQGVDRDNIRLFAEVVEAANACGIPVMGEAYPLGADFMTPEQLHEQIITSCRIIWELGADMIKTFYTGPEFHKVVEAVPVPIVVLGAAKKDSELSALQMVEQAIQAGARGVAFGRNVFQAKNPPQFLRALKDVVNKKAAPQEAAQKYDLS